MLFKSVMTCLTYLIDLKSISKHPWKVLSQLFEEVEIFTYPLQVNDWKIMIYDMNRCYEEPCFNLK